MWSLYLVVLLTALSSTEGSGGDVRQQPNIEIRSFARAKKLAGHVYRDHQVTFYCGCRYSAKVPDLASCGYVSRGSTRANRIEWEHVVPAENFGQSFVEWREGHPACVRKGRAYRGRDCADKVNDGFRHMEADLYNLVPAIGEVNGRRSNYSMDELPGEPREYGACDIEISDRKFEPPAAVRGDIARIYLYMDAAYPGRGVVGNKRSRLFESWSRIDPVDAWECERGRRIAKVQGNVNWIVERECVRAGI